MSDWERRNRSATDGPDDRPASENVRNVLVEIARHRRLVQRKANGEAGGSAHIPEGGGAPLADDVRSRMGAQLGADLSEVRVHTGSDSAAAAKGMGARAFTVGADV